MGDKNTSRKVFSGTVASVKMKDTAVVVVRRYVKHPRYQKFVQYSKRYKVHNSGNTLALGQIVSFEECRPISKDKKFRILTNERSEKV
ncbi:MAG: 30S ribosomal protein S17 [Candidatus Taylorbacteria bacterium RIFCSPHIGHO2_01_FULL_45_63]|uniref:30S ribosomal protein S17 n=1 Tax=Candidatus Taylorbacteria bacterium RIFCSPHIGHO2_02_FULL_45_35 TaxID=1802311 RepID=A0A1G2MSM3_9BACT|nr:MAG: 30S ribosomal protein S17 [Candidatus Taylorbacteria bacterium RIFCSPHIGHO2_01_FULL_45_63]OHA26835.1 MAG: 30S ribosomal protein S17 [Candidatus Taylorbacteria bacterium RIFCSPHIGHO2_02_FULL_45_35]OHA33635.1 MAG: 30S ribosomal protein S17 [Candidatus Taylorbacteria bacterium RIFCSPLOWO2_01_FULL_45_34b]